MNENYLLHNETAKKLYFEYARHLPIVNISSHEPSNKIYNNVAESFLFNDSYKKLAMRVSFVDNRYINGEASDYEKFKEFCRILPSYAGNPIYLLSHIELSSLYDCHLEINEDNAERIWEHANKVINENNLTEQSLLNIANIEPIKALQVDWRILIPNNPQIVDCSSLEKFILHKIDEGKNRGYKAIICSSPIEFISPNPHRIDGIISKIKLGELTHFDDDNCLLMQIIRILGIECQKNDWTLIFDDGALDDKMVSYLKKSNALPKIVVPQMLELSSFENKLESFLTRYAGDSSIGHLVYAFRLRDIAIPYSRHDYFRRTVCNVIGKWVENGEYTSDEKTLKKLIEDILYNNIKEAIS